LLTRLFEPLNEHTPLALLFAAVAVSAWYSGLWSGLLATGFGALAVVAFVLPSPDSWIVGAWDKGIAFGTFVLVAVLICILQAARQRAEERQREQREWFEVTLGSIGDAVIATDARGHVTFINAVAESLTGWSSSEAAGKALPEIFRVIDADTRQVVENPVSEITRLGRIVGPTNQALLIAKDGTEKPIGDSGAPIRARNGHLIGTVLVFRDVTERQRAEEALHQSNEVLEQRVRQRTLELEHAIGALRAEVAERARAEAVIRESEDRYRQMFERNLAVKLLIDPDSGAIVNANRAAAEFYGYSLEELLRLKITDLNVLPMAQVTAEMSQALAEHRHNFLFRHKMASGVVRDVEVYSGPLDIGGRRLLYSIVQDITQRRQAERALQQAKSDLERKVEERTAELQTLNAELQASLGEKEVLLKEIHHRVKNNMQVISSLLNLQADSIDEPHLLAMFKDSQQRIQSMALVHDILYGSNHLGHSDLAVYIRRLVGELRQSYSRDPEHIRVLLDLDEAFVSMDVIIPCGLLLNELVSNCFKHAFAPDVNGEISVELKSHLAGELVLVVRDNGRGFPERLDFRRADSLGLQLICSLTEQIGGHIQLDRNRGTQFTITFPV